MIAVSDTGPLRYLIEINDDGLLPRLFGRILAPLSVKAELSRSKTPSEVREWAVNPPAWVEFRLNSASDPPPRLGRGEWEAIHLAEAEGLPLILIDDRYARAIAERRGLVVTGTVGILDEAAQRGWIDRREHLERLLRTNIRLHPKIVRSFLGDRE